MMLHGHVGLALAGSLLCSISIPLAAQVPSWSATIHSASAEAPAFIGEQAWPGRSAAHRWIRLTVLLSHAGSAANLQASQLRIASDSSVDSLTALAYQVTPTDARVYVPMVIRTPPYPESGLSQGQGAPRAEAAWTTAYRADSLDKNIAHPYMKCAFDRRAKVRSLSDVDFCVLLKGTSGERELVLMKNPQQLVLLFAVPEGATNLRLLVGDATEVSLPELVGGASAR